MSAPTFTKDELRLISRLVAEPNGYVQRTAKVMRLKASIRAKLAVILAPRRTP